MRQIYVWIALFFFFIEPTLCEMQNSLNPNRTSLDEPSETNEIL